MARRSIAPGFRFHPTDVELIKYYLKRKVMGKRLPTEAISDVDVYKFAPWDLGDKACFENRDFKWSRDLKWYFFCPREKKYAKGGRMNRATDVGFWKTTGKDRPVIHGGKRVGMIRSLIFHLRKPQVQRTNWVMHEYRLEDMDLSGVTQDAFVICMIFKKEGPGPRNGAQYGAPFNEEEWDSDEDAIDSSHAIHTDGLPARAFVPPNNQSAVAAGPNAAENSVFGSTSNSDPSQLVEDEIYRDLGDLGDLAILNGLGSEHTFTNYPEQNMVDQFNRSDCLELNDLEHPLDPELFLELNDLDSPLPCLELASHTNTVPTFDGSSTSCGFSFACNPCGDAQLTTGLPVTPAAQSHLQLGQQPQLHWNVGLGNSDDVFFEENGVNSRTTDGYTEHHNTAVTDYSGSNLGMAEGRSLESLRRGYQRIPYCTLQNLRDPAPVCGAKTCEGYALLPPIGGTSLHVKAEVTRGSGGTKDALSIKLEGYLSAESQSGTGLGIGVTFSRCMNALFIVSMFIFLLILAYIKTCNVNNGIAMDILS